jgi:hypothetical protein
MSSVDIVVGGIWSELLFPDWLDTEDLALPSDITPITIKGSVKKNKMIGISNANSSALKIKANKKRNIGVPHPTITA